MQFFCLRASRFCRPHAVGDRVRVKRGNGMAEAEQRVKRGKNGKMRKKRVKRGEKGKTRRKGFSLRMA